MTIDHIYVKGATSRMIEVALRSSTTGQLLAGKAFGDMTIKYQREGAATATTVSTSLGVLGTWSSGGFVETQIAGLYQFGIPDVALASGAEAVTIILQANGVTDAIFRLIATDAIWESATRTLTQAAASVISAVEGSDITITRGDTLSATLTGLAANTGYVSIDFTVKRSKSDSDDDAILRIRKNASGSGDGLLRLNGAALVSPVVASDGSITIVSATSLTISLAARASDDLIPVDSLIYDIQYIFASGVQTATDGVCNIEADITKAID